MRIKKIEFGFSHTLQLQERRVEFNQKHYLSLSIYLATSSNVEFCSLHRHCSRFAQLLFYFGRALSFYSAHLRSALGGYKSASPKLDPTSISVVNSNDSFPTLLIFSGDDLKAWAKPH
jgi:hypothetical protein